MPHGALRTLELLKHTQHGLIAHRSACCSHTAEVCPQSNVSWQQKASSVCPRIEGVGSRSLLHHTLLQPPFNTHILNQDMPCALTGRLLPFCMCRWLWLLLGPLQHTTDQMHFVRTDSGCTFYVDTCGSLLPFACAAGGCGCRWV